MSDHLTCAENATIGSSNASSELMSINLARSAISRLMKSIGVSIRNVKFDPDGVVEKRTREEAALWDLGDVSLRKYEPALITSCHIASAAYSHTPIDVQRMYSGTAQLHPLLDRFVENLRDMKTFFPPYACNLIIKASIDFVNNMAVESELEEMALRPSALSYVTCKRFYNGIGDAYACFIWDKATFPHISTYLQAVPEAAIFCDYVNDIFSFYKEEIAHETTNFVHERAVVTGKDVPLALFDVVDEAASAVHKSRLILMGDKERDAWERFIAGYIAFHRHSPRYRLDEVFNYQDLVMTPSFD